MATSALFSQLRRSRHSHSLSILSPAHLSPLLNPPPPPPPLMPSLPSVTTPYLPIRATSLPFIGAFRSRAFSTRSSEDHESEIDSFGFDAPGDSPVNSELLKVIGDINGDGEESIFPVRAVIQMLDAYHDLTGFPWWIIIASSTLALRIVLLFPVVLQLHKVQKIAEFLPKLPSPFPPPFSGKSYILHLLRFRMERKAVGCPSFLWLLVPYIVKAPCFLLCMSSIRRMSLDDHPGFNCGGALWFQNLTELSHGYSGVIFPFLIAGLHYTMVQISFRRSLVEEPRSILHVLAKYHKLFLELLTMPIAYIGFCIPQGSLFYWATNSSLSLIQLLALRHPSVLAKLGLKHMNSQMAPSEEIDASKRIPLDSLGSQDDGSTAATKETVTPEKSPLDSPEKWSKIPVEDMSPKELTALSVPFLSSEDKESAIPLLKLALDKDPEYIRALVLMGRVLLLKRINAEAHEYFERAISKLSLAGLPTDEEDIDLLILASQWAGVSCERQGKRAEALVHFERVANMQEPDDPVSKGYYFDGLLLLASTLFDSGRKDEAAKYLRLVVAYNPSYKKLLEQCEQVDDVASSR